MKLDKVLDFHMRVHDGAEMPSTIAEIRNGEMQCLRKEDHKESSIATITK